MRPYARKHLCVVFPIVLFLGVVALWAMTQPGQPAFHPSVPRVWDDEAIRTLELPLADPVGSPKHISSDYYYKIPVRPIYQTYPVYAPGHEPPGYMDWLKQQEPKVVWDDAGHRPALNTKDDWIRAGKIVFDGPIYYTTHRIATLEDVRDSKWYQKTGAPIAKDGTLPFVQYVIRKKGEVYLGDFACGFCHTRVMTDGGVLRGAQGNSPFEKSKAWQFRNAPNASQSLAGTDSNLRRLDRSLFAAPWVVPDPLAPMDRMTEDELIAAHETIPAEVVGRRRASLPGRASVFPAVDEHSLHEHWQVGGHR